MKDIARVRTSSEIYVFPSGHLSTVRKLVKSIAKQGRGSLIVKSIEYIGGHCAQTLKF